VPDDVEWQVIPSTIGGWRSSSWIAAKPADLCTQCWHRRGFLASWDEDPGEAISQWAGSRVAERTNNELRRVGRIFEAHRDEYESELALEALAGEARSTR
jgi:hypothetical protein